MKLTTKCPKCSTVFDVSLDTLQQRKGYTRCTSCAYIFDGFEEVVPEDSTPNEAVDTTFNTTLTDNTPQKPSVEFLNIRPATTQPAKNTDTNTQAGHSISAPQPAAAVENDFIIRTRSATLDSNQDKNHKISDLENLNLKEKDFVITYDDQPSNENKHSLDYDDYENVSSYEDTYLDNQEYVGIGSKIITAFWVFLIAIGVAAFLLQGVYVFRVQIAQNFPDTRPRLEELCTKFGCEMPWIRKPEHILVVHSSLQSHANEDKENTDTSAELGDTTDYILQVVLRNDYDLDQEWPSLVLELTDAAGAKIARKNIAAQQYLRPEYIDKPFGANSEYQVHLPIQLQGLKVNGYQVTTFFP